MKFPVLNRFAILSFLCIVTLALVMSFALSSLLTRAVLEWEWENTAALTRREIALAGLDAVFAASHSQETLEMRGKELSRLFTSLPEVVRVKVWDRDATVLWSDEAKLIGKRFPDNRELREALAGRVTVEIEELTGGEHAYERKRFSRLAEVYVPIFAREGGQVIGVVEVYKTPTRLFATIRWGRIVTWAISLTGGVVLYLVLLPLFRRWQEIQEEALRAHAGRLEQEVAERTRELRARSEQLQEALKTVEASQQRVVQGERLRAVGEMASGVAHDFNNVLASILGRAELLLSQTEDPALQRQLRVIQKVAVDGARTVRRIQEFTRMRPVRPLQAVDLNQVVEEVVEITRSRWKYEAQVKGISYKVQVEPTPVPPVAGDPAELREALTNLLFNALNAMPKGGRITFRTGVERDRVCLAVEDTGIGMTEAVRSRVFEPFFTTKGERGTGLGLSVVYGIITRHGGEIEVQSQIGQGSTFTIRLPVARETPKAASGAPPARPHRTGKILVIDDESEVREVLADILASQGHTVAACADGPAGLDRLQSERFDLVFTDLGMPGLSGWDVAREIKRSSGGTPVALITGWGDRITFEEALSRGVDFVVTKPFGFEEIMATVSQAFAWRDLGKVEVPSAERAGPAERSVSG